MYAADDSACGPDGITYSAWQAAGEKGAELLHEFFLETCSIGEAPPKFNFSRFMSIPKKQIVSREGSRVIVQNNACRELGMNNTDKKLIGKACSRKMNPIIHKFASRLQQGFIPGRDFSTNIFELDSHARIQSWNS
eukprot:2603367-Karenia_brevis.AAC.1